MESIASAAPPRPSLPEELRAARTCRRAARFSRCGGYRWWLQRIWQPERPRLLFIGLNPSTADAARDDPTLRRLVQFSRAWGFGGLEVVNLFSAVSRQPRLLRQLPDPVGPGTDGWIQRRARAGTTGAIWLGWGNHGAWCRRDRQVLAILTAACDQKPRLMLGVTAQGQPRHPLYAPAGQSWQPWGGAAS